MPRTVVLSGSRAGRDTHTRPISRNPVTGLPQGPGFFSPGGEAEQLRKAAAHHQSFLSSPVGKLLNFVAQPGYAVGSALEGHFGEAGRHLLQLAPPVQIAEHLPGGIGSAVRGALSPTENILPGDVSYIHAALQNLPGPLPWIGSAVTSAVLDPTSYVTFGLGGALHGAEAVALQAAKRTAGEELATALTAAAERGERIGTQHWHDIVGPAIAKHTDAVRALEAARGGGVRVGMRVPFTGGRATEGLTLAGSRALPQAVERLASKVGETGPAAQIAERLSGGTPQFVKGLEGSARDYLQAGGRVTKAASYQTYRVLRRAASNEKQRISEEAAKLEGKFHDALAVHNKSAPAPWSAEQGWRVLAHHMERPTEVPLPAVFQPIADEARSILDRYQQVEKALGITYEGVENYIPHILRNARERKAFQRQFHAGGKAASPFWVHAREAPTLQALEAVTHPETGEQLYHPEYNLAKLLRARGHSHANVVAVEAAKRLAAGRHGVVGGFKEVPDVPALTAAKDELAAELERVKSPRDITDLRAAHLEATQGRRGAEYALRVAQHTPSEAAITRAVSRYLEAEARRGAVQAAVKPAAEAVTGAEQGLAAAGRTVGLGDVRAAQEALAAARPEAGQLAVEAVTGRARARGLAQQVAEQGRGVTRASIGGRTRGAARVTEQGMPLSPGRLRLLKHTLDTRVRELRKVYEPAFAPYRAEIVKSKGGRFFEPGSAEHRAAFRRSGRLRGRKAAEGKSSFMRFARSKEDINAEVADVFEAQGLHPEAVAAYRSAEHLRELSDRIDQALVELPFGGGPAYPGAAEQLGEELRGVPLRVPMRAQRAANAQPSIVPEAARPVAQTTRGREAMARYFTSTGPVSEAEQALEREAAATEKKLLAKADKIVSKAERQLQKALRTADPAAIKAARANLRQAREGYVRARVALGVATEQRRVALRNAATAERQADPQLVRESQKLLGQASRAEQAAHRAVVAERGRPVGTATQIERTTRKYIKAQRRLESAIPRAERAAAFNEKLAAQPGRKVTDPEEWARIVKDEWPKMSQRWNEGIRLDPEGAAVVARIEHEITRSMQNPEDVMAFIRFTRQITSHWKSLALLSPGYHFRNMLGDSIGAWWAGARNPRSYWQAARVLRGDQVTVTIRGKAYTADELRGLMRAQGVTGQGEAAIVVGRPEPRTGTRRGLDKLLPRELPGRGTGARISQKVGQAREDMTRAGTYIEMLKRGHDPIEAANRVHEYLYDYGDVSDFINAARRFWLPFITYASKAAPRAIKEAGRYPGFFAHYNELTSALNQDAGVEPGLLPVGQRLSFAIPDPGGLLHGILGASGDIPLTYNPEGVAPFGVLNQFDPHQLQRETIGQFVNPLARAVAEYPTGYRFRYASEAAPVARAPGYVSVLERLGVPIPWADYHEASKKDYASQQMVPGYSPKLDEILNLLPIAQQAGRLSAFDETRRGGALLSILGGLSLSPYDRQQLLANIQRFAHR